MKKIVEDDQDNNFNLLRLVLAICVVLGHFKMLVGNSTYGIFGPASFFAYAGFAVDAFFVVSGYLIAMSYDKSPDFINYSIRRFFRIYPLYALVVITQAALMLVAWGGVSGHEAGTLKYLGFNLMFANFLSYNIDGLLSGLHDQGINPSLWTLKIEVSFYLILPVLWFLLRRRSMLVFSLLYVVSTVYYFTLQHYGMDTLAKQLPGLLRFFVVGMALYRYNDKIIIPKPKAAFLSIALLIICTFFRYDFPFTLIYPVLVGFLVFLCALRLPVVSIPFDISFGVYLLHAPIMQFALLFGVFRDDYVFLAEVFAVVFALAFVVEYFIEKPAINLGKQLIIWRKQKRAA